jgi:hypothetical protein
MKTIRFLTNQNGEKTAVVLPLQVFEALRREAEYGIPEWQKTVVQERENNENQGPGLNWEEVKRNLKRKN